MTQGERIRAIRSALKLSLEVFGEKLGVTRAAMSNIERGQRGLTEQMARSICREYNVSYDYLMHGEGDMFNDLPQTILDELCQQHNLDSFDRLLLEMYIKLSDSERNYLKSKIHEIIDKIGTLESETLQDKIDKEVAAYRADLELEARRAGKLSVSDAPDGSMKKEA